MLSPLSAVGITRHHRPAKNYTQLRNSFLRHAQVSLTAFRVGAYVLSHADGFVQTQAQIAAGTGIKSLTTIRSALDDLRTHGYLVSRVIREHGRIIGTAYAISDTPFTREEVAALTSDDVPSEPCTDAVPTASVPPKKTRSRRDSSSLEEDQPSGGAPSGAAVPAISSPEEEPVPVKTDPDQVTLFDAPSPEPPSAEARKKDGAQLVLAAYVEAWREFNPEGEPLRGHKGRIARDAKALLTKGEATEDELVKAARAMASGPFSNLGVQLNIQRRGQRSSQAAGHAPPRPADYEGWAKGAAEDEARRAANPISDEVRAMKERYIQADVA